MCGYALEMGINKQDVIIAYWNNFEISFILVVFTILCISF